MVHILGQINWNPCPFFLWNLAAKADNRFPNGRLATINRLMHYGIPGFKQIKSFLNHLGRGAILPAPHFDGNSLFQFLIEDDAHPTLPERATPARCCIR